MRVPLYTSENNKINSIRSSIRQWNAQRKQNRKKQRKLRNLGTYDNQLCVLGIFKNEALNIREWVEHYKWQGADKVFLIDNGSTDNSMELLSEFIDSGFVEVISLPKRHKQLHHYWRAFRHFEIAKRFRWLIVADLDEFWFCKDGELLPEALRAYEDIDVIYVNWSMFGSSGHIKHPTSLRLSLHQKWPHLYPHKGRKYAVRTSVIKKVLHLSMHSVRGADSSRTVSDNQKFQINHYAVQSREFWTTVKMTRGDAFNQHTHNARQLEFLSFFDAQCSEEDILLAEMVASLPSK
ncbi:glycosyltransferase family 92 protein [Ruegeria sp. AU67]|uniref:glycosyltransferase family 92 protein n=1 Tax=Ruegeria sp. AU67 TaxID=2108530 RepID=UPI000D69442A|nr:glycosyltransferase family 92 protein [Ruegeria sp. AU67]